jgi:hypothetical protein
MSDLLTKEEEANVRIALRHLRTKCGGYALLAAAMKVSQKTVTEADVSPTLVFKIARFAGVPVGDVLTGAFPGGGVCPHCGHELPRPMVMAAGG